MGYLRCLSSLLSHHVRVYACVVVQTRKSRGSTGIRNIKSGEMNFYMLRSGSFVLSHCLVYQHSKKYQENHTNKNDKQFEAHIDIGMQIDRLVFLPPSPLSILSFLWIPILFNLHKSWNSSEGNISLLFMRNVFLNYWHCVCLQVEGTLGKGVELTEEFHFEIKLQHINCSQENNLLWWNMNEHKMQLNYFFDLYISDKQHFLLHRTSMWQKKIPRQPLFI